MNFEELEHIVRAARELTEETGFIAIGSQSLLVSFPDLPERTTAQSGTRYYGQIKPSGGGFDR